MCGIVENDESMSQAQINDKFALEHCTRFYVLLISKDTTDYNSLHYRKPSQVSD